MSEYVLTDSSCDAPSASQVSVIIHKYIIGQKFGHITVFKHCKSFAHQAFIYLIKNTEKKLYCAVLLLELQF